MNIKVAKTLLILCIVYIVGFYILKFAFPEKLILVITDPNILQFGKFIESNAVYLEIYYILSTYLTFYLFASASSGRFKKKWYELIIIAVAVTINELVSIYMPNLMVQTSTSLMLLVALLCKGNLLYTTITFIIHGYLSQFLFQIRGFDTIIYETNVATSFVLSSEGYIWLVICGLVSFLTDQNNGESTSTILE